MNPIVGIVITTGTLLCAISMMILIFREIVRERRARRFWSESDEHSSASAPALPSAPARPFIPRDSFPPVFARVSQLPSRMPPLSRGSAGLEAGSPAPRN